MVKRIALWSGVALILIAIIGFLVLPPIVKSVASSKLSELLRREVTIQEVRINPFALSAQVTGFSIKDREGSDPLLAFDELYVNLEAVSIFKGGPVVSEISLKSPRATIIRHDDLTYNFSDLLGTFGSSSAKPSPPPESAKPFRFSFNNIQVQNGRIDFQDAPKHAVHTVRDLNIAIPFLSNLPSLVDIRVQPVFEATVNGTSVALHGKTKPFHQSLETQMELDITGIALAKYLEYSPVQLNFKAPSASLDSKLSLSFIQYPDKGPALLVTGRMALNNLAVTDLTDRPLLRFALLDVAIESIDVFGKKVALKTVLLQSPEVHLWREKNGTVNLTALAPDAKQHDQTTAHKPETDDKAPKPIIEVGEITLADGVVTFADYSLVKPFKTSLQALNISLHHFSNVENTPTALDIALKTNAGETLAHTGTFMLQPLQAEGAVDLQKISLNRYAPYFPKFLLIEVEGVLDVRTKYKYRKAADGDQTMLSGLDIALKALRLKKTGEKQEFFRVPVLSIKDTDVDVGAKRLAVGEIFSRQGALSVTRAHDRTMNLSTLTAPRSEPVKPPVPSSAPPPNKSAGEVAPWVVLVKKLVLDQYRVNMEDHVPAIPVTLVVDPIHLKAERLSTDKGASGKVELRLTLNKAGTLSVNGSLGLNPVSANVAIDAKSIDLIPLQPYFTEQVKLVVTSGALSSAGTLSFASDKKNESTIVFDGNAALAKLATVDKASAEDLVKWDLLSVTGIHAATAPTILTIQSIALNGLSSRVIVRPDGSLNLQGLAGDGPKAPESQSSTDDTSPKTAVGQQPPPSQPAKSITINEVKLDDGTISFIDRRITPQYASKLTHLHVKVSGLRSEEGKPAAIDITGMLDDVSPVAIKGTINPLAKTLFADLTFEVKDMELSPLTPYSGKYAGQTIQKGKLSLDLAYRIDQRALKATNKVFIDQFTFGEHVDSPTATKLPVNLAVSLLKDRKGEIRLDLPVAGSLDDPEFSVWGVIVQIVTNLLTKAATSPFALLGSLAGGGEELSYVEFAYGHADLDNTAISKLKTLAGALVERPALKLEIVGHVDTDKDKEGYKQALFQRKLKAQKLTELLKQGESTTSLDQITIAPQEYATYLTKAYKNESFPKPKNFFGFNKDLPVAEMEQLMLAHLEVTPDDLRQLAIERAQAVKEYLQQSGKIEGERLFLLEKSTITGGSALKNSRADFVIRS
jgi:uncharacterized protein involved in outer membrane biogenesis